MKRRMWVMLVVLFPALMLGQSGPRVVSGDSADSDWSACTTEDLANKFKGTVTLRVAVNEEGKPHDIMVVKKLRKDLDKAAVDTVKRWRFQPAMRNGKPVAVLIHIEVNFDCSAKPKYTKAP